MNEEILDSANSWVADHIRRFLDTDGRPRPGINDLLITTRGRKSGKLRRTVLVYATDGERFIVTASNQGADHHPSWYLNLVDAPDVTVQVGTETFAARARTATREERPALWKLMVATMPSYARYEEMTDREIPVVIIEAS